jgi:energy-coupling factor transport system ATP-binding protein
MFGAAPTDRLVFGVEHLSYCYRGTDALALCDVTFDLFAGDRVALVGENGCGKSTLLALLAGLLHASNGSIRAPDRSKTVAIGLVMQNPDLTLFCNTVRDELAFGPRQHGLDKQTVGIRVTAAAKQLSIENLLDEPPQALSQGQRLRTAVAAIVALMPEMLMLDEPTTGQDAAHLTSVLEAVVSMVDDVLPRLSGDEDRSPFADAGATCRALLFATHDLSCVARFARRVLVLAGGRLVADCTPRDLLDDERLLVEAGLRLPPLFEARRRLRLRGITVESLAEELS